MGARPDVLKLCGCQSPLAPVLTQALKGNFRGKNTEQNGMIEAAEGSKIGVGEQTVTLFASTAPEIFKVRSTTKSQQWYFVTKIVLTYCEKKLF